jgi:hypothetical protein
VRYASRRNDYADLRNATPAKPSPGHRLFDRRADGTGGTRDGAHQGAVVDDLGGVGEFAIAFAHHSPSMTTLSTVPLRM